MAESARIRIVPTTAHLQATLIMKRGDSIATVSMYYNLPGDNAINQGNISAAAGKIFEHYSSVLPAALPSSVQFTGVFAKLLGTGTTYDYSASSTNAAVAGAVASADPLPEQDCISIQRLSGVKGPNRRGRIYMPFVPETFVLDSTLTTAGLGVYKDIATAMATAIAAVEADETPIMIPALIDWKLGEIYSISECRVQPEVKSIKRRRNPKRSFAASAPTGF